MNWSDYLKKISDVCEVIAGQSPEGKYYNKEGDGLPFYQGKKEFTEKLIGKPTTWTTKITKEAIKGDILMSVRAPVGPINLCAQHSCIGRGLAAIRASDKVDNNYLFYFLLKHESEIVGNTGAVFNSINKTQIGNIQIPIPPHTEQKQIVAILDKAFAAIDQAKANIEKNIQNAQELFQSKLNEIFSQKGEVWEEKVFGEVFKLKSGDGLTAKNMKGGPFPVFGGNNIAGYHNEYNFEGPEVIIGRVGALCGNVRLINQKFWLTDNAFRITKGLDNFDKKFVVFLLNYKKLRSNARQAAQPVISNSSLKNVSLNYPVDIDEQIIIRNQLGSIMKELKKLELEYQKKLKNLEELKKSILQKAFAGELNYEK